MVQKGRETIELESKGNKRKGVEAQAHDTRNASSKRQSRTSDQTSPTPKKRVRAVSGVPESPSTETTDVNPETDVTANTGVVEVEANIVTVREHEIEKKMELIKQLMEQKDNELKELAYLEEGNNLMDYDSTFTKGKIIHTAKEEPGESVLVGADAPNKKGPGRPAKDPNSQSSRRRSQSTVVSQSPVQGESLQAQSPVTQTSSAPHTPIQPTQPTPQTPTQPVELVSSQGTIYFPLLFFLSHLYLL
jgi:hypothetical protein